MHYIAWIIDTVCAYMFKSVIIIFSSNTVDSLQTGIIAAVIVIISLQGQCK